MMINFRIHFEIYSGNIYSTTDPENFEISESVFLDLQERASNHLMAWTLVFGILWKIALGVSEYL